MKTKLTSSSVFLSRCWFIKLIHVKRTTIIIYTCTSYIHVKRTTIIIYTCTSYQLLFGHNTGYPHCQTK